MRKSEEHFHYGAVVIGRDGAFPPMRAFELSGNFYTLWEPCTQRVMMLSKMLSESVESSVCYSTSRCQAKRVYDFPICREEIRLYHNEIYVKVIFGVE